MYQNITLFVYVCVCRLLHVCITWEDIDVNYSESVCVYVDDDVHAKQGHVKLNTEFFDEGGDRIVAGRGQARHLLI